MSVVDKNNNVPDEPLEEIKLTDRKRGDLEQKSKNVIQTVLGWCKGCDSDKMASTLGIKKSAVQGLYGTITRRAKETLRQRTNTLGGHGVIVIVDIYPEGCTNHSRIIRGSRPILCLAEVKDLPPTYWFEALESVTPSNYVDVKCYALQIIQDLVLPGSVLVLKRNSTLCSHSDLQVLNHLYPVTVTVEGLATYNNERQTIMANLETIWKGALDICEEAQYFDYEQVPSFLVWKMYQLRFGQDALQVLISHLMQYVV